MYCKYTTSPTVTEIAEGYEQKQI